VIITPEEAQKKLRNQADRAFRALVLSAARGLVFGTPVGNPDDWKVPRKGYVGGRARGNWHISIDTPEFRADDNKDADGRMTMAKIDAKLGELKGRSIGHVVYLTNGLPYVPRLEYESWSKQAPHGWVRINLAKLKYVAEEVARRVRAAQ
jgi:hypothetical protein